MRGERRGEARVLRAQRGERYLFLHTAAARSSGQRDRREIEAVRTHPSSEIGELVAEAALGRGSIVEAPSCAERASERLLWKGYNAVLVHRLDGWRRGR